MDYYSLEHLVSQKFPTDNPNPHNDDSIHRNRTNPNLVLTSSGLPPVPQVSEDEEDFEQSD